MGTPYLSIKQISSPKLFDGFTLNLLRSLD